MDREAVIVMMRAAKRWFSSVPSLDTYDRLFTLNSPQAVYLTPSNCPTGWEPMLAALDG